MKRYGIGNIKYRGDYSNQGDNISEELIQLQRTCHLTAGEEGDTAL